MSKICIMSDSHENVDAIKRTVSFFNTIIEKDNDTLVVHAGDIISPIMSKYLSGVKTRIVGVFGNNDGEKNLWKIKFNEFPCGIDIHERYYETVFCGKKILIIHEPYLIDALSSSGKYDFIFYGHTHKIDLNQLKNGTIILNPGEVSGYLTGKSTCAIVDLVEKNISIYDIYNLPEVIERMRF